MNDDYQDWTMNPNQELTQHLVQELQKRLKFSRTHNQELLQEIDNLKKTIDNYKLDLCDQFAMAALTGFLANSHPAHKGGITFTEFATDSYLMADEMLKAREAGNE